ncbi:Ulp1 protease family protein [Colletotrichum orchidophilum]|uniref:Ulp1 protease family protein n=1 Tax=Colletotrichum orchidophilum TaxID=1209926 RepID=A0A1G4AT89_9PEZI|nr:Ulp1 protease family protein [Colletotrichum orchidophilum]OHE92303.1 Ulp1 protease family protein [Colletotrichum orchidophilum]
MAPDQQQIPNHRAPRVKPQQIFEGRVGFFIPREECLASSKNGRAKPPKIEKPRTFEFSCESHRPSQKALVNSGLDHRVRLVGTHAPQQLTTFIQTTDSPKSGPKRVSVEQTEIPKTACQKAEEAEHLREATHKKEEKTSRSANTIHSPQKDQQPLLGILKARGLFPTRSSRLTETPLFTPAKAKDEKSRICSKGRRQIPGPSKNEKQRKFSSEDLFVRQLPNKAILFPRSRQSAYLRPATTPARLAPQATRIAKSSRHLPALERLLPGVHTAVSRAQRLSLKDLVIQPEGRIELFGPSGPVTTELAKRTQGNHTITASVSTRKCSHSSSSFHLCYSNSEAESESEDTCLSSPSAVSPGACSLCPNQSTIVIPPNELKLIEVNGNSRTRRFGVQGSTLKTITAQPTEQESRSTDEGSPATNPSRKRSAQDSEFDLILANATDGREPVQEPLANARGAAVLVPNEEDRPRDYANWLINIMTSVRGTVTKVSGSIVGYVYPRNHTFIPIERLSRDQRNGDTGTKRIKLEVVDEFADESPAVQQRGGVANMESFKTNLIWVDESTRIAHWHHVAPLVRSLRSFCRRIEKRRSGSRDGSPVFRVDDENPVQHIYVLSPYLKTFQQTAWILESIYSHTFLTDLKTTFKVPQSVMNYTFSPEENFAITMAQRLFDHFPDECTPVLIEAGVPRRVIQGISADLVALASRKPMPGLVQRAGLVGKVMKFFRGRDTFGIEASEDPVSRIDVAMPGSFPDTKTNSEVLDEEAEASIKVNYRRQIPSAHAITNSGNYCPPARTTDAYMFVKDHLVDIANQRRSAYKNPPPGMVSDDLICKPSPISALKRDKQSPASLKRLHKSRSLKRVQFSSAKQSTPSPLKSTSFLNRIFGSPTVFGSPLAYVVDTSPLSDAQIDGLSDSRTTEIPDQYPCTEPKSEDILEDSDGEKIAARCQPQLLQHLRKSLNGLEAKGFFIKDEDQDPSSCPPSPLTLPTLADLTISDDKEEELEDLSLALQLLLDVDEARRREEEEKKARKAKEERLLKTGGLRVPRRRLVTSLPVEWTERVNATMRANPQQTLATTAESVSLKRHDFAKVVPATVWLNDEIVNGALQWLDRYVNVAVGAVDVKAPNRVCVAMGSFFYKRLEENGVQNTERALRRYGVNKNNFLNLETILMPICKNNHWTLLVIRPKMRTVSHMDSFNPAGSTAHTNRALAWVQAFLGGDYKASEWKAVTHEAPMQTNGYDCGVFTITNGMCLALGLNAIDAYSGEDLPEQRLRIAGMLLNKGFSGEFDLADL